MNIIVIGYLMSDVCTDIIWAIPSLLKITVNNLIYYI